MSAILDSEAHFEKRCEEIRMSKDTIKAIKGLGVCTMGAMAYTVGTPGQDIGDVQLQSWVDQNVPGLSVGDIAAVKRILFESQTIQLSVLRQSILDPDSSAKVRLPDAEKNQRLATFLASHPGLRLDASMQPGHSLLELTCEQERDNVFKHVAIERCVSRQHELVNQSKPSKMLQLEAGTLAVRETQSTPDQPVHGALALLEGLKRRGYAYVMSKCCSLGPYEAYLAKLFQHFRRPAPEGHQRVTLEQLIQADRYVFVFLLQSGCTPRAKADGSFDMDTMLHKALDSYQVTSMLLPLPAGLKRKVPGNPSGSRLQDGKGHQSYKGGKGKGKGPKGKSKANTASSSNNPAIPQRIRLLGGRGITKAGKHVCFAFNLEGCPLGDQCPRANVCAKCEGPRPITACPLAKQGS